MGTFIVLVCIMLGELAGGIQLLFLQEY